MVWDKFEEIKFLLSICLNKGEFGFRNDFIIEDKCLLEKL